MSESKLCGLCGQTKALTEFSRNADKPDGLQTICRACKKAYNEVYYVKTAERYKAQRAASRDALIRSTQQFVLDYLLEHPCVDCGETDPIVLQFDHQGDKLANVSALIRVSRKRLVEEIVKCHVVCANCHTRRTAKTFNWWKARPGSSEEEHPTLNGRAEISKFSQGTSASSNLTAPSWSRPTGRAFKGD